jgi:photosystem II stability/assembly factor-like uncharacterized protein
MPEGFTAALASVNSPSDTYHVEPDPSDFDHVLVTFHSGWNQGDSGVFESFDGGESWTTHPPVPGGWSGGYDVHFLFDPVLGVGDSQTWLFATQGKGHYRTTDSGASWTKVNDIDMQHGSGSLYYASADALYLTTYAGILKSSDNGVTWTQVVSGPGFLSVIGDGTQLYTGAAYNSRYVTALESDDASWSDFNTQEFMEGPFEMALDAEHGILYSTNNRAGVWALKLQ